MTTTPGHAFVLGSGISGLSLAEILSRNGWRITLVETAKDVGGDASRSTQNWLHTGWLYAGLAQDSAMRGCAKALRLYREVYRSVLSDDVVNVDASAHGVSYPSSRTGWFSPECVHYAFATRTNDLSPEQRQVWDRHLDDLHLRRLSDLGYPVATASDLPRSFVDLMNHWEGDPEGHARYRVVRSTDARIDTRRVLSSLLRMLGRKTVVVTRAEYTVERNGDRTAIRMNGELHTPDLCVMATGRSTPDLLTALGEECIAKSFKSISSPVVVLRRALELPNFIRYTPNLPQTINHIKVAVDGADVSTVGSYDYYPADQRPDIGPFVEKVCGRLGISTSEVVGGYYGTKTELSGDLARRYNHAVDAVNANTFYAIAGKLSQFPLLVNEFASKLDLRTDIGNDSRGTLDMQIGATAPELLVSKSPTKDIHADRHVSVVPRRGLHQGRPAAHGGGSGR